MVGRPLVDEGGARVPSYGILSTFPPTARGIATFSAALAAGLVAHGATVDVVRCGEGPEPEDPSVVATLGAGRGEDAQAAVDALDRVDMAIVQHEYGIYGGRDGQDLLDVLDALSVPCIVVAHTVRSAPTAHQRSVLESVCDAADAVVVMTEHARLRLVQDYDVDAHRVSVIPHGATTPPADIDGALARRPSDRLRLLTWGLLGPGKGIEWAIDALGLLAGVRPRPSYLIAGTTHPKVQARDGEAYREMLVRRSWHSGAAPSVSFDQTYRDLPSLTRLIGEADLVVLPYDSDDQVTSGVLVDAVASGRPVVATAFPHAIELLAGGAGIVVPQRDARALADVVHGLILQPEVLEQMAAECRRLAPELSWPAVARRYDDLAASLLFAGEVRGVNTLQPSFVHVASMCDGVGMFEHADHSQPRVAGGYCTDDMARLLIAVCRHPDVDDNVLGLARLAYRFCADSQSVDGRVRNRRSTGGRWHGRRAVDDCWGRTVWAFGTASARAPHPWMREGARSAFTRGLEQRSTWPRAMAFAALGAAEVLTDEPGNIGARRLLADAVDTLGRPAGDAHWPWPEPRLTYANAAIPEALIAAGRLLDRPAVLDDGLALLGWLLDRETIDGHLSPTGSSGAGPDDHPPMFDQQPIEVAAMADACVRAFAVTGDITWSDGVVRCIRWFLGANDVGVAMHDDRCAAFDGLEAGGVNLNQGAESTLALITTLQHGNRWATIG